MKKTFLFLSIYLLFQSITLFGDTYKKKTSFETNINGAVFCVDKRIELFYIVAMLADYPRINGYNAAYKQDIKEYFNPYLSHEIFTFIKEIGRDWHLDTPTQLMLYFTENFKLRTDAKLPEDLITNCGGIKKIERYQELIRDFAIKSEYQAFLDAHTNFYNTILSTVNFNFRNFDEIKRMENYFRQKKLKYTIILNLLGSGNFGPNIQTVKGTEIYAILQPEVQFGDIPSYSDNRKFDNLIWHEFGHSFINPIVEKYINEINKYSELYDPISSSMTSQAYGNWLTTVREHLTRATTCRLAAMRFGEDVAFLNYERSEIGHRFIYVSLLLEKLKEYERAEKRYKSFEEFFPQLISVFKTVTPDMIAKFQTNVEEFRKPAVGRIPATGDLFANKNVIMIIPTREKDTIVQRQLYNFIKDDYLRNKKIQILEDTLACNKDLSNFNLIVFGTKNGNAFLSKYFKELPIFISDNKIVADKEYIGKNFQIIAEWVNPLNPQMSMLIYTAQKTEDLIRSNRIPYNKGFTIAKDNKVVYYGDLNNSNGQVWLCY